MSGDTLAIDGSQLIMMRIASVLDPTGRENLSPTQKKLFEFLASQVSEFEADRECPIVSMVDHVGNYWRNWLLLIGRTGPYRPSTIMRLLEAIDPTHPISYRMLTLNLRILERDGLIRREVFNDEINHVEYELTSLGQELSDWILSLIEWIERRSPDVAQARTLFDLAR
jgi:DNA-binding HxlR family transcriptional regulator